MDEAHDQTKCKRIKSARVSLRDTITKQQGCGREHKRNQSQILIAAIVSHRMKWQENHADKGQEISHALG